MELEARISILFSVIYAPYIFLVYELDINFVSSLFLSPFYTYVETSREKRCDRERLPRVS